MILIQTFSDGSTLTFDKGSFDNWCVYLKTPDGRRYAPRDEEYFSRLFALADIYGHEKIYTDFVAYYSLTTATVDLNVLNMISELSKNYLTDGAEIEILFTIIYAGMVAEENKEFAILKKRIKRLGMYQTLIEKIGSKNAALFSKGKGWRELDALCKSKGF